MRRGALRVSAAVSRLPGLSSTSEQPGGERAATRVTTGEDSIMFTARDERMAAAYLPLSNVVSVLYEQHAQLRDYFEAAGSLEGEARRTAFDALRELLAQHEAAEEVVLRPATEKLLPAGFTRARVAEEREADRELAELERMDVQGPEFRPRLRRLEEAMWMHASREETDEFPAVLTGLGEEEQQEMGRWMLRALRDAPAHSPSMLGGFLVGQASPVSFAPFSELLDRARERLAEAKYED
jgi:Hemerythrin HHE cation binding domain